MLAVVIAIIVVGVIMALLPTMKEYFDHFVTQMMQ